MADESLLPGDKLKLRFDCLKHIATMSGVGIAAGLAMVEKFSLIEPYTATAGIIIFGVNIAVCGYYLNNFAITGDYSLHSIAKTGGALILGTYLLLVSVAIGAYQEYDYQIRLEKYKEKQKVSQVVPLAPPATPLPQASSQPAPQPQQTAPTRPRWIRFRGFRG